jgi:osmotically-inducible protein OsmY
MLKRLCIIACFSTVVLTGCVPVVVVAGATAGSAIIYDNRSFKQMNIDSHLTSEAKIQLDSNTTLKNNAHINVAVYNSVLLLTGEAPTPELRDEAYNLISAIPGIKHIYNEITVEPPISGKQKVKDSWITTKVKSAMLAKSGLRSSNIRVSTENGVVFLMGDVSHNQADLAADVARRISGVKQVVKVFEYPQ